MKTIKQIADEIGVSKQAVYKRVRGALHTDIAPHVHTIDGVLYVDENGETLVIEAFLSNLPSTKTSYRSASKPQAPHTVDATLDIVKTLTEQLSIKDKLIEKQQQSIHELTAALENTTASLHAAQALHAGTMQKQLMDGEPSVEAEVPKKKGFLSFFRK